MSKKINDGTTYSASVDDNLLGITSIEELNLAEQEGIIRAENHILDLDKDIELSTRLIKEIHSVAFSHIYDWAGVYRTETVLAGQHTPPRFHQVPTLMEQFIGNLNVRIEREAIDEILCFAHHSLLFIHPFKNGNGRTARIFTNLIALKNGYQNIEIYVREGESRKDYLAAVRAADKGNYKPLLEIIRKGLTPL